MNAAINQTPAEPVGVFQRDNGQWSGVVMIERPQNVSRETLCKVRSARTIALAGRRAMVCRMPYARVSVYFADTDLDHVCVFAEYQDGHLQLFSRATKREFFNFAVS